MNKGKDILNILKKIAKILSWTVITILIIIIMFLLFIVVSTKLSQKWGKQPFFSLYTIISPSMTPNINVYDVVFVAKTNAKKLKKGDVISFYVKGSKFGDTPVTHRIIDIETLGNGENAFKTKGDYNLEADEWRYPVTDSDIIGKVLFKIPSLGRLQFFLTSKKGWFIVILLPALAIIAFDLFKLMKLLILKSKLAENNESYSSVANEYNPNVNEKDKKNLFETIGKNENISEEDVFRNLDNIIDKNKDEEEANYDD